MKPIVLALLPGATSLLMPAPQPELRIPACIACLGADPEAARFSRSQGSTAWQARGTTIGWFGAFEGPGRLADENQTHPVAKGEGVAASLFGNEGTTNTPSDVHLPTLP